MKTPELEPLMEKTGIRKSEVCTLMGTSRTAIYRWLGGGDIEKVKLQNRYRWMINAMDMAWRYNYLPISEDVKGSSARMKMIIAALKRGIERCKQERVEMGK